MSPMRRAGYRIASMGLIAPFLFEFGNNVPRTLMICAFFLSDQLIELTLQAISYFRCKGALYFPSAESTGDGPAGTATISTFVYPVHTGLCGCRTNTKFSCLSPTWFSSAFFEFPAVQLSHLVLLSFRRRTIKPAGTESPRQPEYYRRTAFDCGMAIKLPFHSAMQGSNLLLSSQSFCPMIKWVSLLDYRALCSPL